MLVFPSMKSAVSAIAMEAAYEPTPRTRAFDVAYQRTPRLTVLGRGSFGVTFAVRPSKDPQMRYAAKEIPMAQLSEKKRREAFAESELLRTLTHKNIVKCVDTFLTGASLYIVMECATRGDLARHIQGQRETGELFSEATVMTVFSQVCSALAYIHMRKIMHRDLKPANVFVFGSGELLECDVKLGDFGLGKAFEGTTMAQSTVGSPSYFSPEICRSKPYGRKSDIWSLGVVLYELTTLTLPFSAKVVPAVARMICLTEPAPLPEQYTAELGVLVASLLRKDPGDRPAAAALLQDPLVQRYLRDTGLLNCSGSFGSTQSSELAASHSSGTFTKSMGEAIAPEHSGLDMVRETFRVYDPSGRGMISVDKLVQVCLGVAPDLTHSMVVHLLAVADGMHGDAVDYGQFLEWLYR